MSPRGRAHNESYEHRERHEVIEPNQNSISRISKRVYNELLSPRMSFQELETKHVPGKRCYRGVVCVVGYRRYLRGGPLFRQRLEY